MQGNFSYYNPTKLYFGNDALKFLSEELTKYGPTVMLCYGGGSIKRNGIYDAVVAALKEAGKTIVEDAGVIDEYYGCHRSNLHSHDDNLLLLIQFDFHNDCRMPNPRVTYYHS